jgi:CheY-like chemotaxis protein
MKHRSEKLIVLWIEDELLKEGAQLFRDRLSEILELDEVAIIEAPHQESAEEKLLAMRNNPPHLIILDAMLPRNAKAAAATPPRVDMNLGMLLWTRLRALKKFGDEMAKIPVVVLTARGNPQFRPEMEADPTLLWLGKPMLAESLAEQVAKWMRDRGFWPR